MTHSFVFVSPVELSIEVHLEEIVGPVLDHFIKVNITIKQVTYFFGFPIHIKVMFLLYCSLLNVQ